MITNDLIVAIELGSSKIAGAVGRKNADGALQVLAYACEPVAGIVKRGVVYNIDKTADALNSVIDTLERKMDYQAIRRVYVGDGGYTLHSVRNVVTRSFAEETRISAEIVENMILENDSVEYPGFDRWKMIAHEYKIGNNLTSDPVGVNCTQIEGNYLNILAKASVMQITAECFQKVEMQIADDFIAPLVEADVVLTENERRQGCALIDFGAETTTISIYVGGHLRFLSVLPLGSRAITRDLCSLQLEEHEAERLKCEFGLVMPAAASVQLDKDKCVEARLLHDVIKGRFEEILNNVCHQIERSGYAEKLRAGVVCCGGGINMKGIEGFLSRKLVLAKYRLAAKTECPVDWGKEQAPVDGTFGVLVGLLMAGQQNCFQQNVHVEIQPQDYNKAETLDLFTPTGESAQEERDKKAAEQAALQEQEQEAEREKAPRSRGILTTLMNKVKKVGDKMENFAADFAADFLKDDDENIQ